MTYFYADITSSIDGKTTRYIFVQQGENGFMSFEPTPDNPNTPAYEAWVAEGNEPQPWKPPTK